MQVTAFLAGTFHFRDITSPLSLGKMFKTSLFSYYNNLKRFHQLFKTRFEPLKYLRVPVLLGKNCFQKIL